MQFLLRQKIFIHFLILLVLVGAFPPPCLAGEAKAKVRRVVMVIMDRIDMDDYNGPYLQNVKSLTSHGSVGLMNNNTGAGLYPMHTYPTLGGGAHLVGGPEAQKAFNENGFTLPRSEYISRTGIQPEAGNVFQLAIGELIRRNNELPYPAKPGALGEALHQAGLKTAVIGNSDTADLPRRLASTISMDGRGLTDMGDVEESVLTPAALVPGSLQTDYAALLNRFEQFREKGASLMVIETGDTTRIYEEKDKATDKVYQEQRAAALIRTDRFIGQLVDKMDFSREILLVVTPTPTEKALGQRKNLTFVFALGPGFPADTLLTSGTTKRDGIIMNTDLAPGILTALGLPKPVNMSGRSISASPFQPEEGSLSYLQKLNQDIVTVAQARLPFHTTYVTLLIGILGLGIYSLCFNHPIKGIKPLVLGIMSFPLAELLLPLLPGASVPVLALELILATAVITGMVVWIDRIKGNQALIFISLLTAFLILMDIMNGSFLMKRSLLGYDPIVGARFYGIGNEYAGVLMGALLLGTTAALEFWRPWRKYLLVASGLMYLFTVYAVGAPHLGTKVGGAITVIPTFLLTFLLLLGVHIRLRTVAVIGLAALLGVGAFIAFDLFRPPELRSHMGSVASLLLSSGFAEVLNIIQRKWDMNLKLLKYSAWSRVLMASLAVFVIMYFRPWGIRSIGAKYPYLHKGFIGMIMAALISLAVNDAGVLAAATTLLFGAPALLYLALKES
ncbi:hypothetical protein V6C32_06950 [Desulforamulus ruminis]|uniref:hypothetical protein n=1 Tax=Desulforamulus ruminis TaxID=1564 RepID=UPI002FD99306